MRESIALRDAAVHRLASRSPPSIFDFGETNSPPAAPDRRRHQPRCDRARRRRGGADVRGPRLCARGRAAL